MSKISHDQIVGIDVSRDWLDIQCLPDGETFRWPNTDDGHARVAALATEHDALVCFEGCEEEKTIQGIAPRQLPPAQIKALAASRDTRARTDRIEAERIALFISFKPDTERSLTHE